MYLNMLIVLSYMWRSMVWWLGWLGTYDYWGVALVSWTWQHIFPLREKLHFMLLLFHSAENKQASNDPLPSHPRGGGILMLQNLGNQPIQLHCCLYNNYQLITDLLHIHTYSESV